MSTDKLSDLPHLGQFKALAMILQTGIFPGGSKSPIGVDVVALLRAYSAAVGEREALREEAEFWRMSEQHWQESMKESH